jgi:uncharacterized surface protein with fasciclin (FAS1) repeats
MLIKRALTLVAGAALALTLAACGSSSTTADSSTSAAAATSASSEAMTSESMSSEPMESMAPSSSMAPSAGSSAAGSAEMAPATLVGPGCADYAAAVPSGAGSVDGMAQDKVATAASNNPLLTTLVAAVSGQVNPGVDLVNTLNNGEFTVFAPVDTAFAKIDAATMTTLTTDAPLLTAILTYHVVPGQIAPADIVGTHPTANGATLEVTGSGDDLMVNGTSAVICGGVKTANATVYLIDTVLTPPAA